MEEIKPWYQRAWSVAVLIVLGLVLAGAGFFAWQVYTFYSQFKQGKQPVFFTSHRFSGTSDSTSSVTIIDRQSLKERVAGQGDDPFAGPASATHQIVEFLDYDCLYCKSALPTVHDLLRLRPDVKVIIRDFPLLDLHPNAEIAAKAARCIWRQGVPAFFWKFHDLLFANQDKRDADSLNQFATQVGADSRFITCTQNTLTDGVIQQSILDATAAGVSVTPTFFVDGLKIEGAADAQTLINNLQP